jgi:hypothetical protein
MSQTKKPVRRRATAQIPGKTELKADAITTHREGWQLAFRVPPTARAPLEKAAAMHGRSISGECAFRLQQGLRDQDALKQAMVLFMGEHLADVAWEILDVMISVAHARFAMYQVDSPRHDAWRYDQMVQAVHYILNWHTDVLDEEAGQRLLAALEKGRPEGPIVTPPHTPWPRSRSVPLQRVTDAAREAEEQIGITLAKERRTQTEARLTKGKE